MSDKTRKPRMVPLEGVVTFHFSVRVDMAEFHNWKPQQIQAFMRGIAEVLASQEKPNVTPLGRGTK